MKKIAKLEPWAIKKSRYLLKDRWITVRADTCITSEKIKIIPYYVLEYPDWVHLIVIDKKRRILITRQYRHGAKKIISEIPCGTVDQKDRNALEAAKRELKEETGYTGKFILAGVASPNPATHTNKIYTYLVINPVKNNVAIQDPTEIIKYKFMSLKEVLKLIDEKKFFQALHISSFFLGLKKAGIKLPT